MEKSEQATNSHDAAVKAIEGMFGGEEESTPVEESQAQEGEGVETAEAESAEAEATEQETTQEQPEETEVEIDGEVYLVPKKISDRFIQHADYTRKTQDIAEMRRALSAEKEASAIEKAFTQAISAENQQLAQIDAALDQFKRLDWESLDTDAIVKYGRQRDSLKEAKSEIQEQIKSKRSEFDEKLKAASQEAIQAGQKYVEQKIKGFDERAKQELFAYGLNEGYTRDELDRIVDPRIVVTLHKARLWDELQAQKPGITKKAAQAAPVVKPGATQRAPSRVQQLNQRVKQAKTGQEKRVATEDYFAAKFGG